VSRLAWICAEEKGSKVRFLAGPQGSIPIRVQNHPLNGSNLDARTKRPDDDNNKDYSLYFEEAENRLHAQKAVMALAMGDRVSRRRK
jgi:hypothetical protein